MMEMLHHLLIGINIIVVFALGGEIWGYLINLTSKSF